MLDPTVTFLFGKGVKLTYYLRQRPNQSEITKLICIKQSASWVMTSRTRRLEAVNTRGGLIIRLVITATNGSEMMRNMAHADSRITMLTGTASTECELSSEFGTKCNCGSILPICSMLTIAVLSIC
jgi:hypothetical protein